jgi:Calcineurin-like phosphoesterase
LRTVIVSDLHVGSRQRRDLLRRPAVRERLLEAVAGADELVLLGDALELRDLPLARVLRLAQPLLSALGGALRGGRIVLVPGNHDHRLAAPVLDSAAPLGLGRQAPARGGAAGAVALALDHPDVVVSYPGFWIRPDVWATHGHYMDAHTAAATLECMTSALMQGVRLRRRAPRSAEDYELALAPLYRALYALAQRPRLTAATSAAKRLLRVLEQRARAPQPPAPPPAGASQAAAPAPAGAARRAIAAQPAAPPPAASQPAAPPLAPIHDGTWVADVMALLGGATARAGPAAGETRRAGIGPMIEVLRTLSVDAAHVVFGHTHRAFQVAAPTGSRSQLTSTGSWVLERGNDELDESHRPGVVTVVGSDGPPRIERVLDARQIA